MFAHPTLIPILEKEDILALPTPFMPDHEHGIYFLLKENEIQYVGISESCIRYRITQHIKQKFSGSFDRWASIQSPSWNIHLVEAMYIEKYNPPLNFKIPCIEILAGRRKPWELIEDGVCDIYERPFPYQANKERLLKPA